MNIFTWSLHMILRIDDVCNIFGQKNFSWIFMKFSKKQKCKLKPIDQILSGCVPCLFLYRVFLPSRQSDTVIGAAGTRKSTPGSTPRNPILIDLLIPTKSHFRRLMLIGQSILLKFSWKKANLLKYILKFSAKISFNNRNFCHQSKFLSNIEIFVDNQNFPQKSKFPTIPI